MSTQGLEIGQWVEGTEWIGRVFSQSKYCGAYYIDRWQKGTNKYLHVIPITPDDEDILRIYPPGARPIGKGITSMKKMRESGKKQ